MKEAQEFKDKTKGSGQVHCPRCKDVIAWGNIIPHMTSSRLCPYSKIV